MQPGWPKRFQGQIAEILAPAVVLACFAVAKLPMLSEPHYWDALACYIPQARFVAEHGTNWAAYHHLSYLRPPLITVSVAALLRVGASREILHAYLWLWAALGLLGTYYLCLALGAVRRTAVLAMVLCAASPLYLAQAGMVQLDLPAAALCTWAWTALLRGSAPGFVLLASLAVLTKESSYFLCVPAVLLLAMRGATRPRDLLAPRVLVGLLPAAVPGIVLAAWLLLHKRLVGVYLADDHSAALFAPSLFATALFHSLVENGRWCLVAAALLWLRPALRGPRRTEALSTGAVVVALPFCFSGALPRYMLPSLPSLCALSALGLAMLAPRLRIGAASLVLVCLVFGWQGDSWHENGGHHLEANFAYRRVIDLHREAARFIASQRPRAVIGYFPMETVLLSPPDDGYLDSPLPLTSASSPLDNVDLCRHDIFVETQGGAPLGPALANARRILEARGLLTLLHEVGRRTGEVGQGQFTPFWARVDHRVRIYRFTCAKKHG